MIKVNGIGSLDAQIAIIGEAPGSNEIAYNPPTPFVGPAGYRLQSQLNASGIIKRDCWITNIWKYKLKGDDFSPLWEDKKETIPTEKLQDAIKDLILELQRLKNLKIIIPLGNHPTFIFCGKKGITKYRGSILPIQDNLSLSGHIKCIPTFHPAFILRQYLYNPIVIMDLKKAKRELKISGLQYPEYNFWLPITVEECLEGLKKAYQAPCAFLDIETIPAIQMITRVGLAWNDREGISIPFYRFETCRSWWSLEEEKILWRGVNRFLASNVPKAIQHIPYERAYLEQKYGLKINNVVFDPIQAQHIIAPGLAKSDSEGKKSTSVRTYGLGVLTSIYTRQPYYKDDGKETNAQGRIDDIQHSKYNITDCCISLEIMKKQQEMPIFQDQKNIFSFEMAMVNGPLDYMNKRGIRIDIKYKHEQYKSQRKQQTLNALRLYHLIGQELNLNSPSQVAHLLYDELKIPSGVSRTTDAERLLILKAKYPDNLILDHILANRTLAKTAENFATKIDQDDRMRCQYVKRTQSGRLSSTANAFGTGTNLQNRDRRGFVRKQFIADSGMILVENDLEQAELKAVAYFSNCTKMLEELEGGKDIFASLASKCLGKPITKKDNKAERDAFKQVVHGARNLMGGKTLSVILMKKLGMYVKYTTCQGWIDKFFLVYPEIKDWQNMIIEKIERKPTLCSPLGRRIEFFDRPGLDRHKRAVAWTPQSFVVDLLDTIMLECFNKFNAPGTWELLLQNHDAFLWQCKEEEVDYWINKVRECFNKRIIINHTLECYIPVEFKVGKNWGEMEVY